MVAPQSFSLNPYFIFIKDMHCDVGTSPKKGCSLKKNITDKILVINKKSLLFHISSLVFYVSSLYICAVFTNFKHFTNLVK